MVLLINPFGERKIRHLTLAMLMVILIALLALCFFRAAVFAEPTVAEIEEVSSLMHGDSSPLKTLSSTVR
jgi:hypothetical protein